MPAADHVVCSPQHEFFVQQRPRQARLSGSLGRCGGRRARDGLGFRAKRVRRFVPR